MCVSMDVEGTPVVTDRLHGFIHRWGIESDVHVSFTEIDPPTVDSAGFWSMHDVIAERPTTIERFDLRFNGRGDFWFRDVRGLFGTAVQIDTQELLDQMLAAGGPGQSFTLTVEFTDTSILHVLAVQ